MIKNVVSYAVLHHMSGCPLVKKKKEKKKKRREIKPTQAWPLGSVSSSTSFLHSLYKADKFSRGRGKEVFNFQSWTGASFFPSSCLFQVSSFGLPLGFIFFSFFFIFSFILSFFLSCCPLFSFLHVYWRVPRLALCYWTILLKFIATTTTVVPFQLKMVKTLATSTIGDQL